MIYVEDLQVSAMSKSAKGTEEEHGKNVETEIRFELGDTRPILVRVPPLVGL